jgi:hypothetical protein
MKKCLGARYVACGIFLGVFFGALLFSYSSENASLEVKSVRQMRSQIRVPVVFNHFSNVASGQLTLRALGMDRDFSFEKVSFEGPFNGSYHVTEDRIHISFISLRGENISGKKEEILSLDWKMKKDTAVGSSLDIEIEEAIFQDRLGSTFFLKTHDGRIEKNYVLGDITGRDEVSVVTASQIIQYTMEGKEIVDSYARGAADVNADGTIGLLDAQLVLDYLVGKKESFFTIKTNSPLPSVLFTGDYYHKLESAYGNPPYQWSVVRNGGSLPRGLSLNKDLGVISGKVTSLREIGEKFFTVEVVDRDGFSSRRQFGVQILDSQWKTIIEPAPVSVRVGQKPNLPQTVEVIYKDQRRGFEEVEWEDLDTGVLGRQTVRGNIRNSGASIHIEVIVMEKSYLVDYNIHYFEFLNIHTILLKVKPEVFAVKINDMDMLYEGEDWFGKNTSLLKPGTQMRLFLYDKFGKILETTQITVDPT